MTGTVFVAGAGGAIGRVLCRLLLDDGWRVVGTTRREATARELERLGVAAALLDVFDRDAVARAVVDAGPDVIVHQLTDLPKTYSPEALAAARAGNARIREVGTANLVAAARQSRARRLVAQSVAFAYAAGPRPFREDAPLDRAAWPSVATLEELVLNSGLEGLVLRYGRLYGPGTWTAEPPPAAPVHVEAAADAARRAVSRGAPGVYNVAEHDGVVSACRAERELGWRAAFRLPLHPGEVHDRSGLDRSEA